MSVRTCLLISDDPDDHIEFTEALYEIADDVVVLIVPDPGRASDLVLSKRHIPDYLIVDLGINGFTHDDFFAKLQQDPDLSKIFIVAYGDDADYANAKTMRFSTFLNRDSTYSDMRTLLRKMLE
jgi:hypothetical protein